MIVKLKESLSLFLMVDIYNNQRMTTNILKEQNIEIKKIYNYNKLAKNLFEKNAEFNVREVTLQSIYEWSNKFKLFASKFESNFKNKINEIIGKKTKSIYLCSNGKHIERMKSVIFMLNKKNSFIRDFQYLSNEIKQMKKLKTENRRLTLMKRETSIKDLRFFSQDVEPTEEIKRKGVMRKAESCNYGKLNDKTGLYLRSLPLYDLDFDLKLNKIIKIFEESKHTFLNVWNEMENKWNEIASLSKTIEFEEEESIKFRPKINTLVWDENDFIANKDIKIEHLDAKRKVYLANSASLSSIKLTLCKPHSKSWED